VDLSRFNAEQLLSEPVFADQVYLADVIVGSKADLVQQSVLDEFQAFAEGLFPPKAQVMGWCWVKADPAGQQGWQVPVDRTHSITFLKAAMGGHDLLFCLLQLVNSSRGVPVLGRVTGRKEVLGMAVMCQGVC
jgi:hypothetical protein